MRGMEVNPPRVFASELVGSLFRAAAFKQAEESPATVTVGEGCTDRFGGIFCERRLVP